MNTYKITNTSHFKHLWVLIPLGIILPTAVYFLMIYRLGYYNQSTGFLVGIGTFLLGIFPVILLHLNHYLKNQNSTFEYSPSSGQIVYREKETKLVFDNNDIQKITVLKSWPLAENRTQITPWDTYNYAIIELKNGQVIKISSLLVYELDKILEFDNIEVKKTFYAWIY